MINEIRIPSQAINLGAFRRPTSVKMKELEPIIKDLGSQTFTSTGTTNILSFSGLGEVLVLDCGGRGGSISGNSSYRYLYKAYKIVHTVKKSVRFYVSFYTPFDDRGFRYGFTLWTIKGYESSKWVDKSTYEDKEAVCAFSCSGNCPWDVVNKHYSEPGLNDAGVTVGEYNAAYTEAKEEFIQKHGLDRRYFRSRF